MSVLEFSLKHAPRLGARARSARISRSAIAAVAIVCVLVGAAAAGSWRSYASEMDEGLLLVYPELMLHHEVPFKDFQSSYGPGTYLPLMGAYAMLGPSVTVERAVAVSYHAAIGLALLALMWPFGAGIAVAGSSLASVVMMPTFSPEPPVAYGWFFAIACLLWALWCCRRAIQRLGAGPGAGRWWAVGGLLAGLAVSARPDVGAAGLVACCVPLWAVRRRAAAPFTAGLAAGASPLIWNLFAAGWSNIWRYGVQAREHQLPLSGYPFPMGQGYLAVLGACTLIVGWAALRERRRRGRTPLTLGCLAIVVLSLLALAQTWQRPDPAHFAFVAPVSFGLLPWALSRGRLTRLGSFAVPVLSAMAIALAVAAGPADPSGTIRSHGRSFPVYAGSVPRLQRTLDWVDAHVPAGDRLFVGPEQLQWAFWAETELYYLEPQLRPTDFYLELGPGDDYPAFTRRLEAGLRRADVLVLERLPIGLFRTQIWPEARIGSLAPVRLVHDRFRRVFHSGAYSVWVAQREVASLRPASRT